MPSYIDQISTLGPKVWYRFNETSGTPVNSGSLSTTATFENLLLNEQTSVDGRAIYFNGSSSRIILPSYPAFSLFDDKSFTIEMWIKASATDVSSIFQPILFNIKGSAANQFITLELGGSARSDIAGKVALNSQNGSGTYTEIISASRIDDDAWHHIVVTINTTSIKIYIDGTLSISGTPSFGSAFSFDIQTNKKAIGHAIGSNGTWYKGRMDEFAIYDRELTSGEIAANYTAGASVAFTTDVLGTASSLMVQPTVSASFNPAAQAPMTASAASGDHYNSTVTFPTLLDNYMSTLTLEFWHKFNSIGFVENFGTGLQSAFANPGQPLNNVVGGIQGTGSYAFETDDKLAAISTTGTGAGTSYYATALNDENFTIGFWTKKLTPELIKFVNGYVISNQSTGDRVTFSYNANGGITFLIRANNTDHSVASTTDITDGQYHFVAGRLASNTMELFIDGVSIGTTTMNHGITLDRFDFQGTGTTDAISISQFFLSTAASVTSTEITNIYNAGIPTFLQASAYFPEPRLSFASAFNNYIESKSPIGAFRMDEAAALPQNYGSAVIVMQSLVDPVGYTQNEISLNNTGFNFTKPNQGLAGFYALSAGTLSTNNVATFGVLFKLDNKTETHDLGGFGGVNTVASSGNGIQLQILTSTGYIRVLSGNGNSTTTNFDGNVDYADSNWHLAIAVQEASSLKVYVDGKLHINQTRSTTFTDNGAIGIGRRPIFANSSTTSINKRIDEVFALSTALTAQEAFEAYQALRLEMGTTATALAVEPSLILGTGNIYTAAPATASGLIVMPTEVQEIAPNIATMNAHAVFQLPNFGGNVVIDVNYGTTAFAADAEFHIPGFSIGEINSVVHMQASGLMVHPVSIAGGSISVNPGIALDATLVMPGIVTIKGALVRAETLNANAFMPLPPAYITLADDPWFVRLLEGHSDKKTEFVQANLSSLATVSSTEIIQGGFLSFFDDVLSPITQSTNPNTITSEIPNYYFAPIGDQQYDANGNLIALDTSKNLARVTPSRGALTPTPIVSVGYFDNQQRKAVRISNIEIPLPGTSTNHSIRPYNLEFSFKATKQNQVLAYGQFTSYLYNNSRKVGAIGLYNGKIYLAESFYTPTSAFGEVGLRSLRIAGTVPHPINFEDETSGGYMLGNKNIADGQWHHVVIQRGYTDNRTQIWIDGVLDKQVGVQSNDGKSSGYANIPGSDASQEVRPYIIGFNSSDTNLASDFQTSGWNFYPGRFLEEREISLNSLAFIQAEPIKPEPMTAIAASTPNTKAAGNKARALLLYWWPVTRQFGSESIVSNDRGNFGPDDSPTFDTSLYTYDYENQIPQDYYGWDIFPVSVTGYSGIDISGDRSPFIKDSVLLSDGYYINPVTSAPRYLDVLNDIDLSAFDAIFFRNYPDQPEERDSYIREEYSDKYFNLKEKELYNDFIVSLRAAVDTGVSLFITNSQLAIDLGIIEGYEIVPDLYEGDDDPYALSIVPGAEGYGDRVFWVDMHRNNRARVVNTIDNLTTEPGYIWQDWAFAKGNPEGFSGEADRPYVSLLNRPNGLQVGDTFVISDATTLSSYFEAVPFAKVKAGKIVTAFANTVRQGLQEVTNLYKNYAISIALEPGTILNGTPTVGKIFVNFTERLARTVSLGGRASSRPSSGAIDNLTVDLIQDEWINIAYDNGEISLAAKNALLAANYNIDRQLEAEIAGQNRPQVIAEIQRAKYWDGNGNFILTQKSAIEDPTGALYDTDEDTPGFGKGQRRSRINKVRKNGTPSTGSVVSSLQWFSFTYSYQYPRIAIQVPSILTRGFRWLSNRIVDEGTVVRTEAVSAIASMPNHLGIGNKDNTVNAQAMLSLATIVHAPIYSLSSVLINTLPLTATATFGQFAKNILANVLTASALVKQPRVVSIQEDEVVLYIHHVDPILYLREDVIK